MQCWCSTCAFAKSGISSPFLFFLIVGFNIHPSQMVHGVIFCLCLGFCGIFVVFLRMDFMGGYQFACC